MNAPNQPTPLSSPNEDNDELVELTTHEHLGNRINDLETWVNTYCERVDILEARVAFLESGREPVKDELGEKILAFLSQFPKVKFNTGSIAANVGSTSMKLSDKLKVMVGKGLIQFEKQEGLSAMFWFEERTKD